MFSEERVEVLVVFLSEHCTQFAWSSIDSISMPSRCMGGGVQSTMLDVPLVQFRRKCLLELLDIRLDPSCVRVLFRGIYFPLVT